MPELFTFENIVARIRAKQEEIRQSAFGNAPPATLEAFRQQFGEHKGLGVAIQVLQELERSLEEDDDSEQSRIQELNRRLHKT